MTGGHVVAAQRAPAWAVSSWAPYYAALYPPARVPMIVNWKVVPAWLARAEALWREREALARDYRARNGADPAGWPHRHPGVVLGGRYAACLGCRWIVRFGDHPVERGVVHPAVLAQRHQDDPPRS